MNCEWQDKIFSVSASGFRSVALEIFRFQCQNNPVYSAFISALRINPAEVDFVEKIPFLPISFFKTHAVKTGEFNDGIIFESSGTTQSVRSLHYVKDAGLYKKSFIRGFEEKYGPAKDWCIIGLLPSYLERKTSSLVYMVNELVNRSGHPQGGFYLNEFEKLSAVLEELEARKQKTILLGVTFALLDFAKRFPMPLRHTIIMETGGMKGRGEEMTRVEVHTILKNAFAINEIHSEYGMTELLSQAYSHGDGLFRCPAWMKVLIRDEEDPMNVRSFVGSSKSGVQSQEPGYQLTTHDSRLTAITGAINIIDLANIYSCSFIATDDVGKLNADGSFEVLGRMDGSDLRGCGLMIV